MHRRRFLTAAASAGATLAAGSAYALPERQQAFRAGLADNPWLLGYANADRSTYDATDIAITGKLPKGLTGSLYRNGPGQHEVGDFRYAHWFAGDGLMQRFQLADGKVRHRARFVDTFKRQQEQQAGRALYPGFDSVPPNPAPVTGFDDVNVANISVLHHHGKLFALWEAGSPHEIDPDTLETVGTHAFSEEAAGVPFSAHPRVDADGNLWNFGYVSGAGLLVLWHVAPDGTLKRNNVLRLDPISMPHDFIVTDRYLVILMPPLHYDRGQNPNGGGFLSRHRWAGDDATRVLVIDKNDLSLAKTIELPAQWVFHFGNGYDDGQGRIVFDAARADDPLFMFTAARGVMSGQWQEDIPSRHVRYTVDVNAGTASETFLLDPHISTEFPTIDPRVSCARYRRVTVLARDTRQASPHNQLDSVAFLNIDSGALIRYRYPGHQLPEEHLFVPASGSVAESKGWVVGTALDFKAQQTVLNVFDAEGLADGPIASAALPYALPLGLHGKWVG